MHAPREIDVQDSHELVAARGVVVAAHAAQQLRDPDVRPHDGVEHPFETQVCHAFEAVLEGVDTADGDGARGREALAGEEAQKSGFPSAIGADEERAGAWGEGEADLVQARGLVGECVGEVADGDGGREALVLGDGHGGQEREGEDGEKRQERKREWKRESEGEQNRREKSRTEAQLSFAIEILGFLKSRNSNQQHQGWG